MVNKNIIGSIDGSLTSSDSLIDRGLAYGHGLFETMRLHRGQLPLERWHLSRLIRDAATLGIPLNLSVVEQQLYDFQQHLKRQHIDAGVIKLIVSAGLGGRGYKSPAPITPRIICLYAELPDQDKELRQEQEPNLKGKQGICLRHCDYRLPCNPVLAGIKHLNRLDQVMARNEWSDESYADGLMFDQNNFLIETTAANIFLHTPQQGWVTPSLNNAGVSGVMRQVLLEEIFPQLEIPVTVVDITAAQLADCDQMFTCNSVRGIRPVIGFVKGPGHKNIVMPLTIGSHTNMVQSALADHYPCFQ